MRKQQTLWFYLTGRTKNIFQFFGNVWRCCTSKNTGNVGRILQSIQNFPENFLHSLTDYSSSKTPSNNRKAHTIWSHLTGRFKGSSNDFNKANICLIYNINRLRLWCTHASKNHILRSIGRVPTYCQLSTDSSHTKYVHMYWWWLDMEHYVLEITAFLYKCYT